MIKVLMIRIRRSTDDDAPAALEELDGVAHDVGQEGPSVRHGHHVALVEHVETGRHGHGRARAT